MVTSAARENDSAALPAAVQAFDAVAPRFDERYGQWASVQAQRRAVRRELLRSFPPTGTLLELGGGIGDDAIYLAERGYRVLLTDGSPTMVACARERVRRAGAANRVMAHAVTLETLGSLTPAAVPSLPPPYDGAFSNFAAFNCVKDLAAIAPALAALLRPGAPVLLVIFGPCSVGELVVQSWKGDFRAATRRFSRGDVVARLGGREFTVRYPSPREVARQLAPHFTLVRKRGIGIFVPPSAAEPTISALPRLVRVLETLDRAVTAPLALLADHVLLHFVRNPSAGEATLG